MLHVALPSFSEKITFSINNFFILFNRGFGLNILNSLSIGFLSGLLCLLLVVPAVYASHRSNIIRNTLKVLIYISLILTGMNTMVPLFILFMNLKLIDSHLAVILTVVNNSLPISYFILYSQLKKIPFSLFEQAKIEGANIFFVFGKILLPMLSLSLLAVFIQTVSLGWESFISPFVFLTDPQKFPVSLRLYDLAGRASSTYPKWGLFSSGAFISAVIIAAFLIPLKKWTKENNFLD